MPAHVEARVCELRRQHPYWGPVRIRYQLGRDSVDEFREQHDESAAAQARLQFGDAQCEVGFVGGVTERGRRLLQAAKGVDTARRQQILAHAAIEAVGSNQVGGGEGDAREQEAGVDRVVEPRNAVNRFAHQMARVEREDDHQRTSILRRSPPRCSSRTRTAASNSDSATSGHSTNAIVAAST